jgi:hypothetical protein
MTPGRQKTPLDEKRGRAWTATTDFPVLSTTAASSLDRAANSFAMWVMPPVISG